MSINYRDLDITVIDRIFDQYLKDKVDQGFKLELLKEMKILLAGVQTGSITLDDAREYLYEYFTTIFGDQLTDEEYSEIIEQLLKLVKLVAIRKKALSRAHRSFREF
jgi:hypothetical protein